MRGKNFALSAYALQSRMEMSNLNMQNTKRAWPEWLVKEIVNPINFSNTFYVTWAEKKIKILQRMRGLGQKFYSF